MTLADEAEFQRELDRLFALPLDEFTQARNELARRAREEGQRARAARVMELRKPTLPAWVVNQLARRREVEVRRLIEAGERVAAAQADAMRGRGADEFQHARQEESRALQQLRAAAGDVLADAGRPSGGSLDRVVATLRAAALTEEGRSLLGQGRLTEELEPPGFEALAGVKVAARARVVPPKKRPGRVREAAPQRAEQDDEAEQRRQLVATARKRVRELRAQLRESERRAKQAERRAATLKKEHEAAEQKAEALQGERRTAEEAVAAAERELEELTATKSR